MPLAEDQNMIQALAPDCADQALNIWNSARATSVRSGGHAAEQRDECTSSNVTCHAPLPRRHAQSNNITSLFDHSRQLRAGRDTFA